MATALHRAGIEFAERSDGWTIQPGQPWFADLETREDHLMVMALTALGLAGDGVRRDHPCCIAKTCPGYLDLVGGAGAVVARTPAQ